MPQLDIYLISSEISWLVILFFFGFWVSYRSFSTMLYLMYFQSFQFLKVVYKCSYFSNCSAAFSALNNGILIPVFLNYLSLFSFFLSRQAFISFFLLFFFTDRNFIFNSMANDILLSGLCSLHQKPLRLWSFFATNWAQLLNFRYFISRDSSLFF